MQRVFLTLVTTAILAASVITSPALAVDLGRPVSKAPNAVPAPAPVDTWSGLYLGGGTGYGRYTIDNDLRFPALPPVINTTTGDGWFGTAVLGIDRQFADRWVAGVFGDYDWTSFKGTHDLQVFQPPAQLKMTSAWAVGGRFGYLVTPATLLYATGGYSQAKFDAATFTSNDGADLFTQPAQRFSGWFAGAGLETQLGANWSARIEYRYADYGARQVTIGNATPHTYVQDPAVQTLRVGLNYRFAAPLVAR